MCMCTRVGSIFVIRKRSQSPRLQRVNVSPGMYRTPPLCCCSPPLLLMCMGRSEPVRRVWRPRERASEAGGLTGARDSVQCQSPSSAATTIVHVAQSMHCVSYLDVSSSTSFILILIPLKHTCTISTPEHLHINTHSPVPWKSIQDTYRLNSSRQHPLPLLDASPPSQNAHTPSPAQCCRAPSLPPRARGAQ